MDQNANTNELKWGLTSPVKFIDKECGEVDVLGFGTFTYQVINQEVFNTAAAQSNMDADTYARGILLTLVIEEIGKYSGRMVLSLPTLIKGENLLNDANSKVSSLGFIYTLIKVENIKVTDESANKMKEIETTKIKAAITGKEIAGSIVPVEQPVESAPQETVGGTEKMPEKGPSSLAIIIMAIVAAFAILILFR